jgi:hypothetical protein
MSIVKCVFLYIERPAKSAVLDRRSLPLLTGKFCRSTPAAMCFVDCDKESVVVGLSKSALLDFEDAGSFEFLEVGADAALTGP